ncbi:MAG: ABC transporter ATP-binding protein [Phycisphaerae bacterium]|nr:ABC transporter ATP-binding protein [Phycisphaerae bacterium]
MIDNKDYVLTIDGLKTYFEVDHSVVKAVDDVSLKIERGKTLAIVGESGCGKSVTAYSILKLIQKPGKIIGGKIVLYPSNGKAINISELNERSELLYHVRGGYISMIFQEPMTALSPVHTIGNQICEAVLLHSKTKISRKCAEEMAVEMLNKAGMPNSQARIRQYPHEISGGMRQRAVIAMAMITNPELLIADEPTTALDVTIQAQIIELMKKLQNEYRTAIMLITHDFGVVAQTADEVAVMYLGNIVEQASVREIIKNPMHPYTIALLGSLPGIGRIGKRLAPVRGSVPDPLRRPQGCTFHPRCEYAEKGLCDVGLIPGLEEVINGHKVACRRVKEIRKNGK